MAAAQRLAAYEDCGRLPEEVAEICKNGQYLDGVQLAEIACALFKLRKYQEAEKQGLLVTPPCNDDRRELPREKGGKMKCSQA
jgi:hypothetical protein